MLNPSGSFVTKGYDGDPKASQIILSLTDDLGEKTEVTFDDPHDLSFVLALLDDALTDLLTAQEEGIQAVVDRKGEGESVKKSIIDASQLNVDNLEAVLNLEFSGEIEHFEGDEEL